MLFTTEEIIFNKKNTVSFNSIASNTNRLQTLAEVGYINSIFLLVKIIEDIHVKDQNTLTLFKTLLNNNLQLVKAIFPKEKHLHLGGISDEQIYSYLGIRPHTEDPEIEGLCSNELCCISLILKSHAAEHMNQDIKSFEETLNLIIQLVDNIEENDQELEKNEE